MRFFLLLLLTIPAAAQWQLQDSHSAASLRGIHAIGKGVAWASGSEGTVLRTVDQGKTWEHCAVPAGGEKLDFRGVQAFDAQTAIVMSSGKGDLSRLYKTEDGCKSWKLLFTDPDADGFFDSIQATGPDHAIVLGDSVNTEVRLWSWTEGEETESIGGGAGATEPGESSFAASNSVLQIVSTPQLDPKWKYIMRWVSGNSEHFHMTVFREEHTSTCEPCAGEHVRQTFPNKSKTPNAGIFSFAFRSDLDGVLVGGNYSKPAETLDIFAYTSDGGMTWKDVKTSPHGYRSAVAYDSTTKAWITVGPNGTDASTDDGRNWHALTPGASGTQDEDKGWNALSLPFVVGSKGRIGILRADAIKP